jgi:hypothetical protein
MKSSEQFHAPKEIRKNTTLKSCYLVCLCFNAGHSLPYTYLLSIVSLWRGDSSVGTAIKLWASQPRNQSSIPNTFKRFLSFSQCLHGL